MRFAFASLFCCCCSKFIKTTQEYYMHLATHTHAHKSNTQAKVSRRASPRLEQASKCGILLGKARARFVFNLHLPVQIRHKHTHTRKHCCKNTYTQSHTHERTHLLSVAGTHTHTHTDTQTQSHKIKHKTWQRLLLGLRMLLSLSHIFLSRSLLSAFPSLTAVIIIRRIVIVFY